MFRIPTAMDRRGVDSPTVPGSSGASVDGIETARRPCPNNGQCVPAIHNGSRLPLYSRWHLVSVSHTKKRYQSMRVCRLKPTPLDCKIQTGRVRKDSRAC